MTTATRNAAGAIADAVGRAAALRTPDAWEAVVDAAMTAADLANADGDASRVSYALDVAARATVQAAHARQGVAA